MLEVLPKPPAFCVRFVIQVQFNRNHWHCENVHSPGPCIDSMFLISEDGFGMFWPASQLPENSIRQYDMDHICAGHVHFALLLYRWGNTTKSDVTRLPTPNSGMPGLIKSMMNECTKLLWNLFILLNLSESITSFRPPKTAVCPGHFQGSAQQ